jgi:peptidoglycan/xylan/chitin deacetylase (PgdA/CDA1 family)
MRAVLVLAATVLLAAGWAGPASARTYVSLVFDAGTANQARALPLLAEHGLRATFYVSSGSIGHPNRLTWGQLRHMQAIGHEIGGETIHHTRLPGLPRETMRREVCADRERLLSRGLAADAFAYPFGAYSSEARDVVVGCGYSSARLASGITGAGKVCPGCPYAEEFPPRNPFAIRVPAGVQRTSTVKRVTDSVAAAQRSGGGWVQILLHQVCNRCNRYAITVADLDRLLGWLKRRDGIEVRTVGQLLDAGGPSVRAVPIGATVRSGRLVTLRIARRSAGVRRVRWFIDGRLIGTRTISPYRLKWVARRLDPGHHTLRALLEDGAGNAALSPQTTFRSR